MFAGDTKIHLLRDLANPVTLADLAKSDSLPEPIFTFNGFCITVGYLEKVISCGKVPVKQVMFDNHEGIIVTPDQEFLLLDGTPTKLKDIELHKSLMPLYLSQDKHGYPTYQENTDYHLSAHTITDRHRTRKVSRMVAEAQTASRLIPNTYVNYIDGNKYNCHPINLAVTTKSNAKQRKFVHPFVKAVIEAQKIIETHPKNHKVVEISSDEQYANVYGCVVSPMNNVAIGGVFMVTADDE